MWKLFGKSATDPLDKATAPSANARAGVPVTGDPDDDLPAELQVPSRLGGAIAIAFFALFWNGVTFTVFGSMYVAMFVDGVAFENLFCIVPFSLAFIGVGVFVGGMALSSIGQVFNPKPTLVLSKRAPSPGESVELLWSFNGHPSRIRELTLLFEGYEEVTYRRGTDTVTEEHVFFEDQLVRTTDPAQIPSGVCKLRIPDGAPPTTDTRSNDVLWRVHILGDIARWPDIDDTLQLKVRPGPVAEHPPGEPPPLPAAPSGASLTGDEEDVAAVVFDRPEPRYAPGEIMHVAATLPMTATGPAWVRWLWTTEGKGTKQTEVAAVQQVQWQDGSVAFSQQLPEVPWSLEGTKLSFVWLLEITAPSGIVVWREPFVLGPDRAPCRLG